MRAYLVSERTALLDAVDAGMSTTEAARVFGVGRSTINRFARRRRETGSLLPKPHPGRPPLIRPDQHAALQTLVYGQPTASLAGYPLGVCRLWREETGTLISSSTFSRTLHVLGFSRRGSAR